MVKEDALHVAAHKPLDLASDKVFIDLFDSKSSDSVFPSVRRDDHQIAAFRKRVKIYIDATDMVPFLLIHLSFD